MRLKDKVAIITGAGQGIGRACAAAFAREGARIVIADRNADQGEAVAAHISDQGGEAIFVQVDVAQPAQVAPNAVPRASMKPRIPVTRNSRPRTRTTTHGGSNGRAHGDAVRKTNVPQITILSTVGSMMRPKSLT